MEIKKDGVSKREDKFEKYFQSSKIRKAFIVGNGYEKTLKCDRDAIKFAEVLERYCKFTRSNKNPYNRDNTNDDYYIDNAFLIENNPLKENIVVLTNTSKLLDVFKKYLELFNYSETSIEFIFYFSGHGQVNQENGLKIKMEDGKDINLEKIVTLLEEKEKSISEECEKSLKMTTLFKKLFILDCCRSMENETTNQIDGIEKIFKEPSYRFKEHKNTAFLYSSNIGFPSFTFNNPYFNHQYDNPYGLSVLTSSLIQRIKSIRAPGRNLIKTVSIIQNDLLDIYTSYRAYGFYEKSSKEIKDINDNDVGVDENDESIQCNHNNSNDNINEKIKGDENIKNYKNQVLNTLNIDKKSNNLSIFDVFDKITKEKFNILFGDICVGRFIFVEGEEENQIKEKENEIEQLKRTIELQKNEIEKLKNQISNSNTNNNQDQMDIN